MLWSKITMQEGTELWINLDHIQIIEEPPPDSTGYEPNRIGIAGGLKMSIKEKAEEVFANAVEVRGISIEEFITGVRKDKRGETIGHGVKEDGHN